VNNEGIKFSWGSGFNDNIFNDIEISNIPVGKSAVRMGSGNINNIFLNVNYVGENIGAGSELIRKWYLDVNVADSVGALENAEVLVYDSTLNLIATLNTDSSGLVKADLTEYINLAGIKIYEDSYTVEVNKQGFVSQSQGIVLSGNLQMDFVLESNLCNGADLNVDYKVDIGDLALVGMNWISNGVSGDVNRDGDVDIADLAIVGSNWGKVCP